MNEKKVYKVLASNIQFSSSIKTPTLSSEPPPLVPIWAPRPGPVRIIIKKKETPIEIQKEPVENPVTAPVETPAEDVRIDEDYKVKSKKETHRKYYIKNKDVIKAKRRERDGDEKHKNHKKFMNKKHYFEQNNSSKYDDPDHQTTCNIGICANYVHPKKIKKRKLNKKYYERHKEKIRAKRRPQEQDEEFKAHKSFMNKERYLKTKNIKFTDPEHQTMCNIGKCANFVPFILTKKSKQKSIV